jgi:hypothetical protein
MDTALLKQAIEDAKAVRQLVLSWNEPPQFWGVMGYDGNGNVVRSSCHCEYCHKEIPLDTSASHAVSCTVPQDYPSGSFNARFRAKLAEESDIDGIIAELEKELPNE